MPGYTTHITGSATVGLGIACLAKCYWGLPMSEAIFSGVLCAIGGVLPDIDSDGSKAHKRCMTLISASLSLLVVCRIGTIYREPEPILIAGGTLFLLLYYGVGTLVQKFSVHRGMFHSIPFAFICSEIIFIVSSGTTQLRLFKAFCIFLGVLVHLTLDELSSARLIQSSDSRTTKKSSRSTLVKSSFGTALKIIDYKRLPSTIVFYAVAALLAYVAMNLQPLIDKWEQDPNVQLQGRAVIERMRKVYPSQFDLSVVQWVAENDMVLSPGTDNNPKWNDLEKLLSLESNADDPVENREAQQDTISLLDIVNWDSLHSSQEDASISKVNK